MSYGQYWCDLSFEYLDIGAEDPRDYRCLSTYADARYRGEGCPGSDWTVSHIQPLLTCQWLERVGEFILGV